MLIAINIIIAIKNQVLIGIKMLFVTIKIILAFQ